LGFFSNFEAKNQKNEEVYTEYKPTNFYGFAAKIWKKDLKSP